MDADLQYFSGLNNLLDEKQLRDYADEEADEWPKNKKLPRESNADFDDNQDEQPKQFKKAGIYHDNYRKSKDNHFSNSPKSHNNNFQKTFGDRPPKKSFGDKPAGRDFNQKSKKQFNKK